MWMLDGFCSVLRFQPWRTEPSGFVRFDDMLSPTCMVEGGQMKSIMQRLEGELQQQHGGGGGRRSEQTRGGSSINEAH